MASTFLFKLAIFESDLDCIRFKYYSYLLGIYVNCFCASIIRTKFKFTILTHYLANLENVATGYMFIIEERIWEKPCNEVSFRQRCKRKLKLHSIRGSGVQHVHICYLANCFNFLVEFLFLIFEYGLEKWFRNILYKLLTICTRLLMPFRLG